LVSDFVVAGIGLSSSLAVLFKDNTELLKMVYDDLAQPGVRQVGKALETVLSLSNTILLPLKLLNENTKVNFESKMRKYKKRIQHLEEDKIFDVPPEIGIPILEKFTYISDNDISELFINLLSKASCHDTIREAHPKFINLISSLAVDEARILTYLAGKGPYVPTIQFYLQTKPKLEKTHGFSSFEYSTHKKLTVVLTGLENQLDLIFPENIVLYMENLENLGILNQADDDPFLEDTKEVDTQAYLDLQGQYKHGKEFENLIEDPDIESIVVKNGRYCISSYGLRFVDVCCKNHLQQ